MSRSVQDAQLTGAVCDLCRSDRHAVPVLEAGDYEYGVPGRFTLSHCTACDLYYQTPRPDREVLPTYYPPTYAVYGDDPVVGWLFRLTYWLDARRVARLIGPRGRVLDVGCGAGRVALALQDKGLAVTGLDTSRGAIDVATHLGVRDVVRSTVDEHARSGERYDSFVLFGNNAGLLEGRERAPRFLAALAALARPGATAYVQGTDPYHTTDEVHLAYQERNRTLGRMGGQLRLRIRYRELSTDWFDYLLCSPAELAELVAGTPWRLSDVDSGESPVFLGTLRLR